MASLKADQTSGYCARRIGFPKPKTGLVYEFYVCGKHSAPMFSDIFKILSRYKIDPFACEGYFEEQSQTFSLSFCVDLNKAKCSSDELLLEIRKIPSVSRAEKQELKDRMFNSYMHPLSVANMFNAVAIAPDPLLQIERRLSLKRDGDDKSVESIVLESGREYGRSLVQRIADVVSDGPKSDPTLLLDNVRAGFKAMGWGVIDFRFEEEMVEALVREIPNPVDSTLGELNKSAFLFGLIWGVAERLTGTEMTIKEASTGRVTGILRLFLTPSKNEEKRPDYPKEEELAEESRKKKEEFASGEQPKEIIAELAEQSTPEMEAIEVRPQDDLNAKDMKQQGIEMQETAELQDSQFSSPKSNEMQKPPSPENFSTVDKTHDERVEEVSRDFRSVPETGSIDLEKKPKKQKKTRRAASQTAKKEKDVNGEEVAFASDGKSEKREAEDIRSKKRKEQVVTDSEREEAIEGDSGEASEGEEKEVREAGNEPSVNSTDEEIALEALNQLNKGIQESFGSIDEISEDAESQSGEEFFDTDE